ncbi:hypothetical protein [Oricola cellulosilytica]|uniref:Uncharacterized protein n=1 Tax=Oricola cellulosilytica TaxID=1429082 RepID=A0A4R0P9A7_9HYPH|nr:hypothetical protein [Oricola cellulosilytica]TCD13438.1 hypothetical protein E0D97_13240 [Oricola cellulosilytica]
MENVLASRKVFIALVLAPAIGLTGLVSTPETAFAQQAGGNNGGNNGGGRGGAERSEASSGALEVLRRDDDRRIARLCIAAPCFPTPRPKRRTPVESVSIAPDCTCELRTVRSGGQFIQIKDCYKVVGNQVQYCEPLAQ